MFNLFNDLANLLFPANCSGCGQPLIISEHQLCLHCIDKLPRTNFHHISNNIVENSLKGRILFEKATAFCYFRKDGIMQHLIHQLKYKNNFEIGIFLGELMGKDLINCSHFANIDIIIPIPIHPKKKRKRGYNQSEQIGIGLAKTMNKPLDTSTLIRNIHTDTQTKKSRYARWQNVADIFAITNSNNIKNKHILLIDDVITTGSTLESAANTLLKIEGVKISIACIACAIH